MKRDKPDLTGLHFSLDSIPETVQVYPQTARFGEQSQRQLRCRSHNYRHRTLAEPPSRTHRAQSLGHIDGSRTSTIKTGEWPILLRSLCLYMRILQPSGKLAYIADQSEADRLLRTSEAKAVWGAHGQMRALRLRIAIPERRPDTSKPTGHPAPHLGVVRPYDLLAPSPRHDFWFRKAVFADLRDKPQRLRGSRAKIDAEWDRRLRKIAAG